jgi:hypothetical protein
MEIDRPDVTESLSIKWAVEDAHQVDVHVNKASRHDLDEITTRY